MPVSQWNFRPTVRTPGYFRDEVNLRISSKEMAGQPRGWPACKYLILR